MLKIQQSGEHTVPRFHFTGKYCSEKCSIFSQDRSKIGIKIGNSVKEIEWGELNQVQLDAGMVKLDFRLLMP